MIDKILIHSSVGGGPMERLAAALDVIGVHAECSSLFSKESWRYSMRQNVLGRGLARAEAMGLFPAKAIAEAVRAGGYLLVPTTNPFFLPHLLVASGAIHGLRVVPLIYDLYPDAWEVAGLAERGSLVSEVAMRANRRMFSQADGVVFIGANMARAAIERYGEPRRWTVIETGASWLEFEKADARIARNGWELDWWLRDRVLISYAGNLGLVHDWRAIASGVRMAFRGTGFAAEAACLIAASGPGEAFLQQAWQGLGTNRVRFLGPLSDSRWADTLSRSDVSVVSLGVKATGTSVPSKAFSAMAARTAVIAVAPEHSDLATLVRRHECGIVVPPGDGPAFAEALMRLVRDPGLRKRLAANGLRAAREHYDLPRLALRWVEFLGQVGHERTTRT